MNDVLVFTFLDESLGIEAFFFDFAFMLLLQLFVSNNFPYLASYSKIEELTTKQCSNKSKLKPY